MSVLSDCWENIIGITRKEDACLTGAPDNYSASLSGLYLDELRGVNLRFVDDLTADLWGMAENSIENAIRTFKMDVMAELLKHNKERYQKFIGNIGSQRFKNSRSLSKDYSGVRVYCNDIRGGVFKLNAIGVLMDTTAAFDVTVYDNLSEIPVDTIAVTSVANTYTVTTLASPLELPLSEDEYDNLEYFFIYSRGSMQPKDNKATCGCGGVKWCWSTDNPCFVDKALKDRWRQWAMIGGISGDTIADREDWGVTEYMNGIVLIGEFICDKFIYLCNENTDFTSEVDQAIAYSVLYKAGEFLMDEFLDTTEVSRFTALGLESINNNRQYYNERYVVMIDFIVNNLDIERYGCLQCLPTMGFKRQVQML